MRGPHMEPIARRRATAERGSRWGATRWGTSKLRNPFRHSGAAGRRSPKPQHLAEHANKDDICQAYGALGNELDGGSGDGARA